MEYDWKPQVRAQFWRTLIRVMRQPLGGGGGASLETLDRRARFNNRKGASARRRLGFRPSDSARAYATLRSEIKKRALFELRP